MDKNLSSIRRYHKTPHVLRVEQRKGKTLFCYIGAIDNNYADAADVERITYVEAAVDNYLPAKRMKQTTTAAIGYSIKSVEITIH